MRKLFLILFFLYLVNGSIAQVTEPVNEQQLENISAQHEDAETEDDYYVQQLQHFLKDPVNLNTADESVLKELILLTTLQVQALIVYRNTAGPLIDMYELQAVPGWDPATIRKLRPFITVSLKGDVSGTVKSRLKKGEHTVLFRISQVLEKAKGYSTGNSPAADFYPGSPQKILIRYKYNYRNLLQYGIVAEKDAGEQFFKGKQKLGFDFYSFHLFVRKVGLVRALAVGDFAVNLGQGLIQWQSLSFGKGSDAVNVKRQADILRPYNSAGETDFHRGIGITLGKKRWQLTGFVSYRNIDAHFIADSLQLGADHVSSLQTSGYHRSKTETADKGIQHQLVLGGNLSCQYKRLHLGLNGIHYRFSLPINRSPEPYNRYALTGKNFANYSLDYSYTFRNMHLFGELAFNSAFDKAIVNGLLASLSPSVDMCLLYRNISASYQSLYSSAFTENTYPSNEMGFYAGITLRPGISWRIDAYADLYRFPWLKYRVDAPTDGSDYLIQASYIPNKRLEIYSRYRVESKSINENIANDPLSPVIKQPRKDWRIQLNYDLNPAFSIRSRTEMLWFDKGGPLAEQGFFIFLDLLYKSPFKPYNGTMRLGYFETGGYNSRLYSYENDVLYSFSTSVFYDKGYRYYINMAYDINKKLGLQARFSQTIFPGQTFIGSGLDEIRGNHKTELKFQAMYKF